MARDGSGGKVIPFRNGNNRSEIQRLTLCSPVTSLKFVLQPGQAAVKHFRIRGHRLFKNKVTTTIRRYISGLSENLWALARRKILAMLCGKYSGLN